LSALGRKEGNFTSGAGIKTTKIGVKWSQEKLGRVERMGVEGKVIRFKKGWRPYKEGA